MLYGFNAFVVLLTSASRNHDPIASQSNIIFSSPHFRHRRVMLHDVEIPSYSMLGPGLRDDISLGLGIASSNAVVNAVEGFAYVSVWIEKRLVSISRKERYLPVSATVLHTAL